jgi:hypothetical protein
MMDVTELFDRLWRDYARLSPQAARIRALLEERGERIVNDHVALRTFDDPRVSIDVVARPFVAAGYRPAAEYAFPEKKLRARHYEPANQGLPLLFVSELRLDACSAKLRGVVTELLDDFPSREDLAVAGRPWPLRRQQYDVMAAESEYAGWLAAFGFRANHFTVRVNDLRTFTGLRELNDFLKQKGFRLNTAGGEIKGSPDVHLEQSSTLGEPIEVELTDAKITVPGVYYEFALRHRLPNGKLYLGFVERSADKIFESTDPYRGRG